MNELASFVIESGPLLGNTLLGEDSTSGLVMNGVEIPAKKLELNKAIKISSLSEAESLGITEAYDKANKLIAHRHISEFFRIAGEGVTLWLMMFSKTAKIDTMVAGSKSILVAAGGDIRQIAYANSAIAIPVMLNGQNSNLQNAIVEGEKIHNWSYENGMPVQVFLEGYAVSPITAPDLTKLLNVEASHVSVFAGQDLNYGDKRVDISSQFFGDVGTLLGVAAKAAVYQNVGNNELFNISTPGYWQKPGLSFGHPTLMSNDAWQVLDRKGYLFGVTYTGLSGVRINNDYTCVSAKKDSKNNINEHTISYGRVMGKAARGLRAAYLPKVKTAWEVNAQTGKLSKGTVASLEDLGDVMFEGMLARGEISYGKTTVDANSDLIIKKELGVGFEIVPKGSIGKIKGTINLKSNI